MGRGVTTMRSRGITVTGWVGLVLLALLWLGPLPALARQAFTAHMVLHMGVVAVVSPLLVLGIAGGLFDPVRRWPGLFAPVGSAAIELVVVWGWHAPALHHAARTSVGPFVLEQASFLGAGLLVWFSAFGGGARGREGSEAVEAARARRGGGAIGLLLTSMHMTLLGALLALSSRPLYGGRLHESPARPAGAAVSGSADPGVLEVLSLTALEDQHLGGAVMLAVGGAAYLAGGLALVATLVRTKDRGITRGVRERPVGDAP